MQKRERQEGSPEAAGRGAFRPVTLACSSLASCRRREPDALAGEPPGRAPGGGREPRRYDVIVCLRRRRDEERATTESHHGATNTVQPVQEIRNSALRNPGADLWGEVRYT